MEGEVKREGRELRFGVWNERRRGVSRSGSRHKVSNPGYIEMFKSRGRRGRYEEAIYKVGIYTGLPRRAPGLGHSRQVARCG